MTNFSTANGGTVFTIPANSAWKGHFILSATLSTSPGGNANTQYPSLDVSGSGSTWDDGHKIVSLALATPAVSLSALTGISVSGSVSTGQISLQTRANPVDIVLNYGTGINATGVACGEIL